MRFQDVCPKCGSHLVLREGQHGEFLACPRFPDCRYTQPSRDNDKMYIPPSKFCEKCNHTGLLPFEKNGRVIPNTFLDCECKKQEVERYQSIGPEDYDFPLSDTYRGFSFEYCGVPDPAESLSPVSLMEERVSILEDNTVEKETRRIDGYLVDYEPMGRLIRDLNKKIKEHITSTDKKRTKYSIT